MTTTPLCGAEESIGGETCTFPNSHAEWRHWEKTRDVPYVPVHSYEVPKIRASFLASGMSAGEFAAEPGKKKHGLDNKTIAAILANRSLFEPFETCGAGVDGLTSCWLPKDHEAAGVERHSWEHVMSSDAAADLQKEALDLAEEPYQPPAHGWCKTCGYALYQEGCVSCAAREPWDVRGAQQQMRADAHAEAFEQALLSASAKIDALLVRARETREDAIGKILSKRTDKLVEIVNALRTSGGVSPDAALVAAMKLYDDLKDSFREMLAPDTYSTERTAGGGIQIKRVSSASFRDGIIETELRAGKSNGEGLLNLSSIAPHFGATIVKPGI